MYIYTVLCPFALIFANSKFVLFDFKNCKDCLILKNPRQISNALALSYYGASFKTLISKLGNVVDHRNVFCMCVHAHVKIKQTMYVHACMK